MLIYEHCPYLEQSPILMLGMCLDTSEYFKQVFQFHWGIEIIFVHQRIGRLIVEQSVYDVKPGTLLIHQALPASFPANGYKRRSAVYPVAD